MTQRAGEFVHFGGLTRLLRLQSGGLSSLSIANEPIREIGMDQPIERIYDNPDATFEAESFDMTTSMERMFTRATGPATPGEIIDFRDAVPIDIVVPWRQKRGATKVAGGAIIPYLYLEQASYRFGVQANAGQTFTLRGDAAYFVPGGSPRYQEFTKVGVGPYAFADTALKTVEDGENVYALCVTMYNPTSGTPFRRLKRGSDFTDNSAGFTLTSAANAEIDDNDATLVVSYGTAVQDDIDDLTLPSLDVRPSAYKGRDIDFYLSDGAATPTLTRIRGVQSVELTWRVQYDVDYELGNRYAVNRDYDVPEVTGNLVMRPESGEFLTDFMARINGANPADIQNVTSTVPLEAEVRLYHPKNHATRMKTLYVPDLKLTMPATPVRVGNKQDYTFPLVSDSGTLQVINGVRAA